MYSTCLGFCFQTVISTTTMRTHPISESKMTSTNPSHTSKTDMEAGMKGKMRDGQLINEQFRRF